MKKKQLITLGVMFVAVILLFAGYSITKNINDKKNEAESEAENEEADTIPVYDIDTDKVTEISYSSDLGSLEITKEGGSWFEKETEVPMSEGMVQSMLDAIGSVVAIRVIEDNSESLSDYGLDKPVLTYTVTMEDKSTYNFSFGSKLQTETDAYYAVLDSPTKVYSVAANYFTPFYVEPTEMIEIEDENLVNTDNITKFAVRRGDKLNFAASYVGSKEGGSAYYTWQIDEPYDNVMADTDRLNEALSKISNLIYDRCIEYDAKKLGKYGLDEPEAVIEVEYYDVKAVEDASDNDSASSDTSASEESDEAEAEATPVPEEMREYSTFTLNVGDMFTDGEDQYYYVKPEDSDSVYRMSITDIDIITSLTAYELADHCIYTVLADQLTGYEIEYEGEHIVVERKKESDAEDAADEYYVNGKKVETEGLLTLYSAAYLLTTSGEADDEVATPDAKPVLTLTYHTIGGKDDVVKYIPYDGDNFYQVNKNGTDYFLTDKRGIDDLISRYQSYMKELK